MSPDFSVTRCFAIALTVVMSTMGFVTSSGMALTRSPSIPDGPRHIINIQAQATPGQTGQKAQSPVGKKKEAVAKAPNKQAAKKATKKTGKKAAKKPSQAQKKPAGTAKKPQA